MDFIPVTSSNIKAIAFEPEENDASIGALSVQFKNGSAFCYYGVPAQKFDEFLDAKSKGKFFISEIKKHYESEKIEPKKECPCKSDEDFDSMVICSCELTDRSGMEYDHLYK